MVKLEEKKKVDCYLWLWYGTTVSKWLNHPLFSNKPINTQLNWKKFTQTILERNKLRLIKRRAIKCFFVFWMQFFMQNCIYKLFLNVIFQHHNPLRQCFPRSSNLDLMVRLKIVYGNSWSNIACLNAITLMRHFLSNSFYSLKPISLF